MQKQGVIKLKELNKTSRKTPFNLFFLELIIVLLFFSISGAIVLRIFASADALAKKNSAAEKSVLAIQSIAEMYALNGDMKQAADTYFGPGSYYSETENECMITLDEELKPLYTPEARKQFGRVSIWLSEMSEQGGNGRYSELTAKLFLFFNGTDEVYSQTSSAYIPDFCPGGKE